MKPRQSFLAGDRTDLTKTPPVVQDVVASSGRSLDPKTREVMESRFRHDFSGVKIHTDDKAAESSRAMNATAYTVGQHIAFEAGRYDPNSRTGEHLLVHELAHVVQQSRGTGNLPDALAEQSAERAASAFTLYGGTIAVAGATAPGIARQKASETAKPSLDLSFTQQAGRTLILINGVAVVESDAPSSSIDVSYAFAAENLRLVVTVPDGKTANVIESSTTWEVFSKLSAKYAVQIRAKLKEPTQPQGELDSTINPPRQYVVQGSFEGQRPKPAPNKKPLETPPANPPTVPSPTIPPTPAPFVFQPTKPSPTDLNLPPTAKYGKPPTDQEIAQGKINKIIADAVAGRPGTPSLPAGIEPRSVVGQIQEAVGNAVKPLISGLPRDVREFLLDKLRSAVEEEVISIAESAVDTAKLDPTTKTAIKKAIEAAIKLKPQQASPGQK